MARCFVFLSSFAIVLCSCGTQGKNRASWSASSQLRLDSSLGQLWAAHPWLSDPSDSVPLPIRSQIRDSVVDVFFIHPTTYTGTRIGWNASLQDSALNEKTDRTTILYQASVFNQHGRVFAPRYRQAHLSAFYSASAEAKNAFDTAYEDVKKAFEIYLSQYHHDRPIIIAGHSQGALLAERLLLEYFDGKPLQSFLVAAYIVGWPIPSSMFKKLAPCRSASETGCVCGWRTFRDGYVPEYIEQEKDRSLVTNPLSWTMDSLPVRASANKGSVLRNFNKVYPGTTGAVVHGGVLWVRKPRFPGGVLLRTQNYHIADINLFYINIRDNVELRIRSYFRLQ